MNRNCQSKFRPSAGESPAQAGFASPTKGFTLVEIIVILAVVAILAAIAIPVVFRIFQVTTESATREEMANLAEAMLGNSKKLQGTFRSDFGFLGDIGRLPNDLDELYLQGSLPSYSFDTAKQTGAGWKGPYITGSFSGEEAEDYKKDQLGNDYTWTVSGGGLEGTLTSNGADGASGTADDLTRQIVAAETTATVRGFVTDSAESPQSGVSVDLHFPSDGTLTTVTATTDSNGSYSFTSVPFGPRSVQVGASGLVFVAGSVVMDDGGEEINFQMENLNPTSVTITHMQADFSGGANYDQIEIDNNTVDNGNNFVSGQKVDIDDTTISAGSGSTKTVKVVVDNVDTLVPDIVVSGGGTRFDIQLDNFNQDVTGISFTVTFFNGTTVLGTADFIAQ